jgi:hypothetical protein
LDVERWTFASPQHFKDMSDSVTTTELPPRENLFVWGAQAASLSILAASRNANEMNLPL